MSIFCLRTDGHYPVHFISGIFLFLFTLGIAFPLQAQESEPADTLIILNNVEVSTSRIPQTAAGTGRNITIIPAKTIESLPAHTTDEVLRYLSSVEVQSRGAFGTQSDFSIRGSTFSQVLVMIDGMRLNDPLTAHFNSNIPVSPAEIKRIEVLHGPAAAQYGADAVGGAINIITKTFSPQMASSPSTADLKLGYGRYELKTGQAGFFHADDQYRLSGGGMWFHTPGQPLGTHYKNRFNIGNASLSAGVALGDHWDLTARTAYDSRDYNARYFYTASPYDNSTDKITAWWNQLRLTHRTDHQRTTLEASYKRNKDTFVFNESSPANRHTTQFLNAQLYQYRSLADDWDLTYGIQADHRKIQSNDRGNHSDWHYAAFSMLQWQPSQPLTLTGNMRLDHDRSYGTEFMPQLSASYQADQFTLRASAGRSIRAPSYTERYVSTNLSGPVAGGRNLGNPWLEAERSWSGEAGMDLFPVSDLKISATAFIRESTNLIDYTLMNSMNIRNNENLKANTEYLYTSNLSSVRTAGLETQLAYTQSMGADWLLQSQVGYTFTDSFTGEASATKYLSNYARHIVKGMMVLQRKAFELSVSTLWKQRQDDQAMAIDAFKSPSYNIWNLKTSYDLTDNLSVGVEVDNLFNERYQDILGAQMPKRWLMGSLSLHL